MQDNIIRQGDPEYGSLLSAFAKEGRPRQMHINGTLYIRQENNEIPEFLIVNAPNRSIAENYAQTSFSQQPATIPTLDLGDTVEEPRKPRRSRNKEE
jgi:hypothetical protein